MSGTYEADRALADAVLAQLRGNPAVVALLGERIYDDPPASPAFPYVTLGRTDMRPWGGLNGEGVEHALTLTCVSRFGGAEEAKAVVAAMRAALHGAELTLTDHRLINLRATWADVFLASDWRSTFGVLRVRAVTETEPGLKAAHPAPISGQAEILAPIDWASVGPELLVTLKPGLLESVCGLLETLDPPDPHGHIPHLKKVAALQRAAIAKAEGRA